MRRRIPVSLALIAVLALSVSCAAVTAKYQTLSEDEQARSLLKDYLDTVDFLDNAARAYVSVNPGRQIEFDTQVRPMFQEAIKEIKALIAQGRQGMPNSPGNVSARVGPKVAAIASKLAAWGIYDTTKKGG